ncbi:unnamed protein product [Nippostrongylus brasiliensis]|uniref:Peptidase A2 domain-containing protein n=1 Tax=Nippostrongylus brasiliensis TaxID=27835 RepID=A0A0N4YVG9_NIPBR|nr:unnamed protein product [Nippostrongylus brasiliensis]
MCSENGELKPKNNSTSSQLVLVTAEGSVWNHNSGQYGKVLFFFDSGAQRTVIGKSLADLLGVPRQTTEICTMSGIGGHTETFESHTIKLRISTGYGEELDLEIQTKPIITNGFAAVNLSPVDVAFLKANSICLANSNTRGEYQKPHVLVGLDYYHEQGHFHKAAPKASPLKWRLYSAYQKYMATPKTVIFSLLTGIYDMKLLSMNYPWSKTIPGGDLERFLRYETF